MQMHVNGYKPIWMLISIYGPKDKAYMHRYVFSYLRSEPKLGNWLKMWMFTLISRFTRILSNLLKGFVFKVAHKTIDSPNST